MRGEPVCNAQSTHSEPVKPSWKKRPMIAIVARRPFAIAAASFSCFFCLSAGYVGVSILRPESPAAVAVPGDWTGDWTGDGS